MAKTVLLPALASAWEMDFRERWRGKFDCVKIRAEAAGMWIRDVNVIRLTLNTVLVESVLFCIVRYLILEAACWRFTLSAIPGPLVAFRGQ